MADKYEWKVGDVYEVQGPPRWGESGQIYSRAVIVGLTKTRVRTAPEGSPNVRPSEWRRVDGKAYGQGIYFDRRLVPVETKR